MKKEMAQEGPVLLARRVPAPTARFSDKFKSFFKRPCGPVEATYSVLKEFQELRSSERRRVKLRYAKIADANLKILGECSIQDLSPSGARLLMPTKQLIPARFHLIDDRDGAVTLVALVWRNGACAGVKKLQEIRPPRA